MMTMMEDDTEGQCPQIWTYVTRHPLPASSDYPIAQSYVDIVLRGCLTISTSFAQEFIQTTKGWNPHASSQEHKQPSSSSLSSNNTTATTTTNRIMKEKREQEQQQEEEAAGGWWVEDRHNPLYIRADRGYSLHHAPLLDKLLLDNLPRSGSSGDETSWLLAKRIQLGRTPHQHQHHHKKKKGRMM
jgi:hypothetical protein